MLPEKIALVDVETSGARVTRDRIIEIGILRIENGVLVKTYQSLINPGGYLSPFIEQYTGITREELVGAPKFEDIAHEIEAMLDDCVFVAHNVRFDYGFLKNEFRRLEKQFAPKHFCTVKLSRALYPQHNRHGLDALIERFNIVCPNRHRALDDAKVMWEFLQISQQLIPQEKFAAEIKRALKQPSLPSQLSKDSIDNLPEGPGVYIFYGEEGYPLYIGKSKNIRERVLSHFSIDHTSSREMHMCQQVASIETIETSGELTALLRESQLVKQMQPLYNRKLRHSRSLVLLRKTSTPDGYETATIESTPHIQTEDLDSILAVCKSVRQAKDLLQSTAQTYGLCHKLLGLEKGSGPCFGSQLGTCSGACQGKEPPVRYNFRIMNAFIASKLQAWPFDGPILIFEDEGDGTQALIVDNWCVVGTMNESNQADFTPSEYAFDLDTYKILRQFLVTSKKKLRIKPFEQMAMAEI
ncbi:MAG TPA: exonuclease domain-containing protein [Patescibacteria group bacterium]